MSFAETKPHLAYAMRYAARLQEKTATCLEADGKSVGSLNQEARKLRVAAELISRGVPLSRQNYPFKHSCLCVIGD